MFLLYTGSFVFIILGLFLINQGLKKKDFKAVVNEIQHEPARNYGKGFQIALGIFSVIVGLFLLFSKHK